jgi:hypothetical protein
VAEAVELARRDARPDVGRYEVEHFRRKAPGDAHARDFFWGLDVNGHGRTRVSPVLRELGGERFVFQGLRILADRTGAQPAGGACDKSLRTPSFWC